MEGEQQQKSADLEEIEFKSKSNNAAQAYQPYVPDTVRVLSITSGFTRLIKPGSDGCPAPESAVYDDGADKNVRLTLKIEDTNGTASIEVPLAMCKYLRPSEDKIYDAQVCKDATVANLSRESHNKYLVGVLNAFMAANDMGTSCNKITLPDPPVDCNKQRLLAIKNLTSDKYGTAKKSIKYLSDRSIYCGKDYKFEEAFEKANQVCFEETCRERAKSGKVRVALPGSPPTWWDGVSPRDSAGNYVAWKAGDGHTFLTPLVLVVRAKKPTEDVLLIEANQPKVPMICEDKSFEKIVFGAPSKTQLTLTNS